MTDVVVPGLESRGEMTGGEVSEGEIVEWLIGDGAHVDQGQPILELALDKANMVVEAPAAGVLRHGAQPGDLVEPGDVVGTIEP